MQPTYTERAARARRSLTVAQGIVDGLEQAAKFADLAARYDGDCDADVAAHLDSVSKHFDYGVDPLVELFLRARYGDMCLEIEHEGCTGGHCTGGHDSGAAA